MTTETRNWTAKDGLTIVGDVGGNPVAPTIVLMHGGGQTRHSWSGATRAIIEAGYHVVNFDARGHGDSDWSPDGRYSLPQRADDLRTVIADVDGPVALVGASLGGATAMRAIADGYRPAALALIDIVPNPDRAGVARIRAFMMGNPDGFGTLDEVADAIAAYNPHRPRPRDTAGLNRNLRLRENGRYYWHWDPGILSHDPDVDLADFTDTIEGLKQAGAMPTLLVRGLQSDVVDDSGIAELAEAMPQLEVFDVAGAGHMVAGDRNDAFNAGILDFLKRQLPVG